MGLKWFRARLSLEKEAAKVSEMTGLYRKISYIYFDSASQKNTEISMTSFSTTNNSTTSDNNGIKHCDIPKVEFPSQSSSSIINSEDIIENNNDNKPQINNHTIDNMELSINDENVKKQSTCDNDSNKINKNQNNASDAKGAICSDKELVI